MTQPPISEDEQQAIERSLRLSARKQGWDESDLVIFFAGSKLRSDALYLPARVPGKDLQQCVERLQFLEDAWNLNTPEPRREIVLVPLGVDPELMD